MSIETISVYFDDRDPNSLGYCVQRDIPGFPGVSGEEGSTPCGDARICATGARPPRRVESAARWETGCVGAKIEWSRHRHGWLGWIGSIRK